MKTVCTKLFLKKGKKEKKRKKETWEGTVKETENNLMFWYTGFPEQPEILHGYDTLVTHTILVQISVLFFHLYLTSSNKHFNDV